MIRLENVSKSYPARGGAVQVLQNINLTIGKGQRLGILGRNGAGKSTLVRLVSGAERPTSGIIHRQISVSWPLAFGGAFLGRLTGYDNFKFVCRLYNVDPDSKIDFVEDFSELGRYLREPLRTYSAGMKARLAFAVSMAVEFDCFLIDEIIAVGDSRFQAKCFDELFVKRADRALLIVSHHADFVREVCSSAAVLEGGVLHACPSVDAAYELYSAQQAVKPPARALASDAQVAAIVDPAVAARTEVANGELLEDRAHSLARIVLELEHGAVRGVLLRSLVQAFSGELEAFDFALRVVDFVKSQGAIDTAIDLLNALDGLHGQKGIFHVVVGDLLIRAERIKEATAAYQRAIELEPESFWGHRNLGIALFNIGCYADAQAAFVRAVALPCSPPLKRELVCYLADCATYLDQEAPEQLNALVDFPGNSIEEVTSVFYPELGLLSVRVQGFCQSPLNERQLHLALQIGTRRHELIVQGPGSNSFRRYAALAKGESFGAELVIRLDEAPGPVSVTLLASGEDLDSHNGGAVRHDLRGLPAASNPASDPAELATMAYAGHDFETCVLFSRLALANGAAINFEFLAESLIALGRYHEAEHNLSTLFDTAPETDLTDCLGGKLFDLLCAEIGRSRLPGWRQRIERLVHRWRQE